LAKTELPSLPRKQPDNFVLLLDDARIHRSFILKSWLEKNKHRIEIFYLSAYSPDLNPDEL
jgi:transposase